MNKKERYDLLIKKANELPSGGIMGMFTPDKKEWALMKIEIINEMGDEEAEPFLKKWEEYFNIKTEKIVSSTGLIINGYEMKTTFWTDFTIADRFGENAIKDTYKRAFNEWKDNYIYLTELVMVLNWKIWEHFENHTSFVKVYDELWKEADLYACENLKGEELSYFYRTTD